MTTPVLRTPADLERLAAVLAEARELLGRRRIVVCGGTGCLAKGAAEVYEAFRREVSSRGLEVTLDLALEDRGRAEACLGAGGAAVIQSGCQGFCQQGPLVTVEPGGYLYVGVRPKDVGEVLEAAVRGTGPVVRLLYRGDPAQARAQDIEFYRLQRKVVLAGCGRIDPSDIRDYIATGGYRALAKALTRMTPEEVIGEVEASGLRGRGGAGFPTGRKWRLTREAAGERKFVVVNGDEGDPGAFMDCYLMEGDPHRVLEGLIIAGYAVGAREGYFYVRAEYPRAVKRLRRAIEEAEGYGLLGDDILGSGVSFRAHLKEGAGAFVCGEETALIASIEGRRGTPRPRPPFPAQSGVWGCPTCINNVETHANVPGIILDGAPAFRKLGTASSPGAKTFALAGQVERTGLIEVPMGTTLREVVFGAGGGIRGGKAFKAVQIGGPSGGCLTAQHLDLPLDYDSLGQAGAIIGSGGLVVMDEDTCMVEVARFFMSFVQTESCGKCVPCREGTRRMLEILTRMTEGEADEEDLAVLEELAQAVKESALCGLGKTAPNPVLTTLRYFRDEYLAHVRERRCPALACSALVSYAVDAEKCVGCGLCARACPAGAVKAVEAPERSRPLYVIEARACLGCDACRQVCRKQAIRRVPRSCPGAGPGSGARAASD